MNPKSQFQVWDCKIVVPADAVLPKNFDWPPRRAAIEAVEAARVPVLACFSGWGGKLTEAEDRFFQKHISLLAGAKHI